MFSVLEMHRPEGCLAHRNAVFLVDNIDDIDNVGGCTDWCLEVEAGTRITRHVVRARRRSRKQEAVKAAAANYCSGTAHKNENVFEYLTDRAVVLRCEVIDA